MSKIKKFPQAHAQINSHIAKIITTQIYHEPTSHTQQNFSIVKIHAHKIFPMSKNFSYPQNFAMCIKQSLLIPINFSHIHHEYIRPSLQHKIFTMPILPKSKPKFIQQHHNLPTLSKFHKSPTLSKLHHDQRKNNTSRMLQSQHFQTWPIMQCPKISK